VAATARTLGLPALLGPPGRSRDLAYALIVSRVLAPGSKLSTLSGWADTTLGADLGVLGASTDEIYAAMDWLHARQDDIEKQLAARHLGPASNPSRIAMFDLSSSWVTGRCCELAARGYSRDGKKGCEQIEYGLLTDPEGRPIAVRVFPGNTADPTAFTDAVAAVKDTFTLANMVMVGDRGMITSARIDALRARRDRLADRAARPGHRRPGRRYRPSADDAVRRPRLRRDHPPPLPRRAAYLLPQPTIGGRTRRQTRRPPRRDRTTPGPDRRRRSRWAAGRGRSDRPENRCRGR
jgi:hypothetical protein